MEINFSCEFCGRDVYMFAENIELVVNPPIDVMAEIYCQDCGTPHKIKIALDLMSDIAREAHPKLPSLNFNTKRRCEHVEL